jgi:hypothetical protein
LIERYSPQKYAIEKEYRKHETEKLEEFGRGQQRALRFEEEKHDIARSAVRVFLDVNFDVRVLCLDCIYELPMHEVVVYEHESAVVPDEYGPAVTLDVER